MLLEVWDHPSMDPVAGVRVFAQQGGRCVALDPKSASFCLGEGPYARPCGLGKEAVLALTTKSGGEHGRRADSPAPCWLQLDQQLQAPNGRNGVLMSLTPGSEFAT